MAQKATGLGILLDEKRVNDLLTQKTGAKASLRSACNILLFVFFLILFTVLALSEPLAEHRAFEGFVRRRWDTSAAMPLREVESATSFWEYLNASFMPAIYGNDTRRFFYPDYEVEKLLKIDSANRLLGVARLRMLKTTSGDGCSVKPSFEPYFPTCYGPFGEGSMDKVAFGPANPQTGDPEFTFSSDPLGSPAPGQLATYPPGGYMEALTANLNQTLQRISLMRDNHFLGPGLRAIVLDWSVYNFNVGAYAVCRILIEVSPSGLWSTTFDVNVIMRRHLSPLGGRTTSDWLVLLGEVILILFVLRYLLEECSDFVGFRGWKMFIKPAYFSNAWNLLDWTNLILIIATLAMRIQTWGLAGNLQVYIGDPAKAGVDTFTELNGVAMNVRQIHRVLAFNSVLTWFKAVKYFSAMPYPYISTFQRSVLVAQRSLGTFIVVFTVLYWSFVLAYSLAFGESVREFRTTWAGAIFLARSFLGNADFGVVYNSAPVAGSILIFMYVMIIMLVMVNLFYAIMVRAMAETISDEEAKQKKKIENFKSKLYEFWIAMNASLRLEYRFRTCFPGLYARLMSRRRKMAEREKERDEECLRREMSRKPDASNALGAGNPSWGRRPKHHDVLHADEFEESDNESEADLGPLKDKAQLSKKGMYGDYEDKFAGNDDDTTEVKETIASEDDENPEAAELVIRATQHVVEGIVQRTYRAQNVLVSEMSESKDVLLKVGSVLEVLDWRAKNLVRQQKELLDQPSYGGSNSKRPYGR